MQDEGGRDAQSLAQGLLLLEDIHFFSGGTDESLANRLQWHIIMVVHYPTFLHCLNARVFSFFSCLSLLRYQVVQLAYVIDKRLKETTEDSKREKALKDIVVATTKDRSRVAEATEKRSRRSRYWQRKS